MRPVTLTALFLSLPLFACSASASDPETLDEVPMSRLVLPPVLAPIDNGAAGDDLPQSFHNTFEGRVEDMTFQPNYSFFLQGIMRVGDAQPTLVFVQTDSPNLCRHMAAGTMPKNASIFAVALVQTDGRPVQVGYSDTAPGHHGMDESPRSMAFFRKLNGTCEVFPDETGAQAMYGEAVIRKLRPNTSVVADYAFDFEEAGSVSGHLEAPYCDAPNFFANPEQFYQPVEPQNCLEP